MMKECPDCELFSLRKGYGENEYVCQTCGGIYTEEQKGKLIKAGEVA